MGRPIHAKALLSLLSRAAGRLRRAAILLPASAAALLPSASCGPAPGSAPPPAALSPEEKGRAAAEWLAAVESCDTERALLAAAALSPVVDAAPGAFAGFFRENGVRPEYLDAPFNEWDFMRWRDAWLVRARASAAAPDGDVERLFNAVASAVSPGPDSEDGPWPGAVLASGRGMCDRQAWLLAEMAAAAGHESAVVYLVRPGTRESPHALCEIRTAAGVWLADPFSRVLRKGMSFEDLRRDPSKADALWPGRPDWRECVAEAVYFCPAYPQDYRPANLALACVLRSALGSSALPFGDDPASRGKRYADLLAASGAERPRVFLWHYPIRALAHAMARRRLGSEAAGPAAPPVPSLAVDASAPP